MAGPPKGSRRRVLTDEERGDVLTRYRKGEPVEEIGRRYGIHFTYPGRLAKRYGLTARRPRR